MKSSKSFTGELAVAALSGALVSAPAAFAADTAATGAAYVTPPVVVTATRVEKDLMEVPASVTVMTAEDVRHSGARTVGELVEDVAGVQINNDGSQGLKRVNIRGEDAFRTLVLIDGQKISEHKSMSGSPMLIDASRIERVEVIKGPASVLYGSDAIGGVINIITKKGGEKPVQGDVFVGYSGASDGLSGGASLYGKVGGFNYRVSGSYADHDNVHTPDGTWENTWFRQGDGGVFLSYDFSDRFTLGASYDYYRANFNSTYMEYLASPAMDFYVKVPKWSREKYNVFAEAKDIAEPLTRVRLDAFYQKTDKDMESLRDMRMGQNPSRSNSFARNYQRTRGVDLQTDWQLGRAHHLIAGYEFGYDDLDSVNRAHARTGRAGMATADHNTERFYEGNQTTHAVFANMETKLPHDFALTYGSRWTRVESELDKVSAFRTGVLNGQVLRNVPVDDAAKVGSESYSRPVFNVGLVWSGVEDLALRASWAQGFRAPILTEKFIGTTMGGGNMFGNPDLDPETSNNFEAGARWNSGPASLDWAFFYSIADDYIDTIDIFENGRRIGSMYTNIEEATTFGSEFTAAYGIDAGWGMLQPYATLTWMRRKSADGAGFETYDSGRPQWFGRYGLRFRMPINSYADLRADAFARSQTAAKRAYADGTSDEIAGFTTLNFSMGIDFGRNREFSLDAEVLNILDKRYQYTAAVLEPGLHANVRLSYQF